MWTFLTLFFSVCFTPRNCLRSNLQLDSQHLMNQRTESYTLRLSSKRFGNVVSFIWGRERCVYGTCLLTLIAFQNLVILTTLRAASKWKFIRARQPVIQLQGNPDNRETFKQAMKKMLRQKRKKKHPLDVAKKQKKLTACNPAPPPFSGRVSRYFGLPPPNFMLGVF